MNFPYFHVLEFNLKQFEAFGIEHLWGIKLKIFQKQLLLESSHVKNKHVIYLSLWGM